MQVKTQQDEIQNYLVDASNMAGGFAEKLFVPETAEEISEILRNANENGVEVTVSGGRTGTVGGAIPFGGYVISLEKLSKIKEVGAGHLICESGVTLAEVQRAAEANGMFYPPDPTEWSCQIGGTVATNASGARSFKYGSTRNFVESLRVVLPTGEIIDISRGDNTAQVGRITLRTSGGREITAKLPTYRQPKTRKNTAGFFSSNGMDAVDLFVGSEGTLGIITEVKLRLLPKPQGFFSGIVFFGNEHDLLSFVSEARALSFETRNSLSSTSIDQTAIDATHLEYFDECSLRFISKKFPETPADMAGAVFFEQETSPENEDALFERWNALLEKHNAEIERSWFAINEQDLVKMRDFRHALPVSVNETVVKNGQRKIGTDMAVPDDKFPSFLHFLKQKLGSSGIEYVIFGHIGDNHLHANLLPKNDEEAKLARHLYGRFIAQSIMLGGTISAEHGIGKLKRHYLYVMYGERYVNEMAELKAAFDPNSVLSRGNMFDEKFLLSDR